MNKLLNTLEQYLAKLQSWLWNKRWNKRK